MFCENSHFCINLKFKCWEGKWWFKFTSMIREGQSWSLKFPLWNANIERYQFQTQIGPKIFLSCDHPAQALSPKQIFFIWDTFLPFFYWPLKMNKRLFILRHFDDWVDTATTLLSLIKILIEMLFLPAALAAWSWDGLESCSLLVLLGTFSFWSNFLNFKI